MRVLAAVLLAALLVGGPSRPAAPAAAPPAGGDPPRIDCAGKPSPPLGDIALEIVGRPAPDRVVLEARWRRGRHLEAEDLELVLPEGCVLLEGRRARAFARAERDGVVRWLVACPEGRDLDAVVRVRARLGATDCARECYARIARRDG